MYPYPRRAVGTFSFFLPSSLFRGDGADFVECVLRFSQVGGLVAFYEKGGRLVLF